MCVFAVCIIMHIVALMPHHHHKGNSIPCLDYSHITHSNDTLCDNHCDGPHDGHHGDAAPADCGSHKIIVAGPEKPELEISACEYSLPDDLSLPGSVHEIMRRISCDEASRLFAEYRSGLDVLIPVMEYIVVAIPSRAPAIIA